MIQELDKPIEDALIQELDKLIEDALEGSYTNSDRTPDQIEGKSYRMLHDKLRQFKQIIIGHKEHIGKEVIRVGEACEAIGPGGYEVFILNKRLSGLSKGLCERDVFTYTEGDHTKFKEDYTRFSISREIEKVLGIPIHGPPLYTLPALSSSQRYIKILRKLLDKNFK